MRNKIFILINLSLLCIFASGQCPDKDSVLQRMSQIRDSPGTSPAQQLPLYFAEEAKFKNCPDRNDSTFTMLLRSIAGTYYKLNDYPNAISYFNKSIDYITRNIDQPGINPKHLISTYYFRALAFDSLNQISEKMASMDSCFTIAIRLKSINLFCLSALYSRVEFFYDIGDYHHCINYASRCEDLGKAYANSSKDKFEVGMGYVSSSVVWKVNALLMLKNYEEAEKFLVDKTKESIFKYNLGSIYSQLAKIQQHKGNYERALFYLNKAFDHEYKLGHDITCKTILNNIGYDIYQHHYNDNTKALFYFVKALGLKNRNASQNALDSIESLNINANIAGIYAKRKSFDSAFKYFQFAFDNVKAGATESTILNSSLDDFASQKKIGYLTSLFIDKADAYFEKYKTSRDLTAIKEAIRIYIMTDRLLDKIKIEQSDLQSKLFWRADSKRLYEHAIDACHSHGDFANAFYFFEKSRAVLLNDQLNEQRWLGESDIRQQKQGKRKVLQLEKELAETNSNTIHYAELRNQLFNERQQMDRLTQLIRSKNPLYYQSFLDTTIISIKDVQNKILADHQAFVEIFSGDSAVYTLIISPDSVQFNKIEKSIFDSLSNAFISLIANLDSLNRNFKSFVKCSHELFELIFRNRNLPAGRIVISPDGQYFPFEALIVNNIEKKPDYFLNHYSVSYTYSARYLMSRFSTNTSDASFLGIAPVDYPADMQLASLMGSDRSLLKVESHFHNANNLLKKDASKFNFLNQFYKYKIIQLYTHASNTSKNDEPVIYFADSAMYLSDISSENKPVTDLIVLAACETGTGKIYQGEGVFSLNRAFAAIGIPSSVTNLWNVDNESIYRVTEFFYKYLAEGKPTDVALQQAKIDFLSSASKEKELPYFWAGSILVGTNQGIEFKRANLWKDFVIIGISIAIFWLLTKKIFTKKIEKQIYPLSSMAS